MIKYHKSQGHLVFFISGSPDFLVSKLADRYGITDYRGTNYRFDEDDIFRGDISQMWDSASKEREFKAIAEKYDIDLASSYAYGDTNGDYSMLKAMGHGVAMNPSEKLLHMIRDDEKLLDKVDIIIERKDVIYKVKADVETIPTYFKAE